ncbi:MAG: hypothetical protein ACJAXR_002946 [Halopseudomonas sp.]|jgi:hypothetical protein|uniref:hypothetical protein n=1 Tax=Halopseudomonas sp. TaxID=2901191 RepID=UPI0039E2C37A
MKLQQIFYTTALSFALAASSSMAFAESHADHTASPESGSEMTTDGEHDVSMNNNNVQSMRNEATDEEMPNMGNRAVPGAPDKGKNPDIDPEVDNESFVE